ncbi:MAG TPA: carbonic anhydrase, partial [Pyrinomonadaceae bacterium]
CELNVIEQVMNVGETTILHDAWMNGLEVSVHGWIYRLDEGIFQDLNVTIESLADLIELRENSLTKRKKIGIGK